MKRLFFIAALIALLFLPEVVEARHRRGGCSSGSTGACASEGARRPLFQGRQLFRSRCR